MEIDLRFKHPCSICVAAPSQGGKTVWVLKLLRNLSSMITTMPERVVYCYGVCQDAFRDLPPFVILNEGLPDLDDLKAFEKPQMVIIDDLMDQCSRSPALNALFTKYVHHYSLTVVFLVQNLYYSNTKTARLNTNYITLFKSPGDKQQIATLGRQLYPGKTKAFLKAFEDATATPYSYILIDLTQTTPDHLRLRTNIFPDAYTIVYQL